MNPYESTLVFELPEPTEAEMAFQRQASDAMAAVLAACTRVAQEAWEEAGGEGPCPPGPTIRVSFGGIR